MTRNKKMSTGDPYSIILADDHALFRKSLRRFIEEAVDIVVVGEAGDGRKLLDLLEILTPNLVIVDISMPELSGIEAVHEIEKTHPDVKVLILTMHKDRRYLDRAVSAGAEGYILKENIDRDLFPAIETIRLGEVFFPPTLL